MNCVCVLCDMYVLCICVMSVGVYIELLLLYSYSDCMVVCVLYWLNVLMRLCC